MKQNFRNFAAVTAAVLTAASCGSGESGADAQAAAGCGGAEQAGVIVTDAWVRAAGADQTSALYATLCNNTGTEDSLTGIETAVAASAELHQTTRDGESLVSMSSIEELPLASGDATALAPGGAHVMLLGLNAPLKEGDSVPVTLKFKNAPPLAVDVSVRGQMRNDHEHH